MPQGYYWLAFIVVLIGANICIFNLERALGGPQVQLSQAERHLMAACNSSLRDVNFWGFLLPSRVVPVYLLAPVLLKRRLILANVGGLL